MLKASAFRESADFASFQDISIVTIKKYSYYRLVWIEPKTIQVVTKLKTNGSHAWSLKSYNKSYLCMLIEDNGRGAFEINIL